jgi:hypothetical protein
MDEFNRVCQDFIQCGKIKLLYFWKGLYTDLFSKLNIL